MLAHVNAIELQDAILPLFVETLCMGICMIYMITFRTSSHCSFDKIRDIRLVDGVTDSATGSHSQ